MIPAPAVSPVPSPSAPLRVALVTETFPPEINGVAMTLGRLAQGLAGLGHPVQVIRPHQPSESTGVPDGVQCVALPGLPIPGYPGLRFGLPAGRRLGRLWSAQPPDVVYVATQGPLGQSAVAQARRLQLPVLSGFHTNFHSYTRHYRIGWASPLVYRFLRRFHGRTQGVLAPTRELAETLCQGGFRNVDVLARGVDTVLFDPARRDPALRAQWGVGAEDPVMLYVGRLAPEKNIELAVRGYLALRQARPRARMVLVGDGPARADLARRHPELIFAGEQRGAALARHYASGDLFPFPSETETFGNVILEALASGLAVLAYDYAAGRMHIRHDDNGLLAPLGDSAAWLAGVTRLAQDPGLVRRLASAGRQTAEALGWEAVVGRFVEQLLGAVQRHGQVSAPRRLHHTGDTPPA